MSAGNSGLFKGTAGALADEGSEPIGFDEMPPESEEGKPVSPLNDLPEIVITGGPTGSDTKVMIDGREINYLTSVRFEANAGQTTKVILTVIPRSVTIRALGEVSEHDAELFLFDQKREAGDADIRRSD